MAHRHTTTPNLTPQFCFDQTALRDFLRLSRSSIDDSITQNLNALFKPGATPWDPSSVSQRVSPPPSPHRQIDPTSCHKFKETILFPSWAVRSDVLTYCASVATSPDPEDPDLLLREIESSKARERVVDERLDPYSGRYFPREARTESLATLVRNERMVENIIRSRSWGLVGERCGAEGRGFEEAFGEWRKKQEYQR